MFRGFGLMPGPHAPSRSFNPTRRVALAFSTPPVASTPHSTSPFSSPSRTKDHLWGLPSTWGVSGGNAWGWVG